MTGPRSVLVPSKHLAWFKQVAEQHGVSAEVVSDADENDHFAVVLTGDSQAIAAIEQFVANLPA